MLQNLDRAIFDFINRDLSHPVLDLFFSFWTDFQKTFVFYLLVALILLILIYRRKFKEMVILLICSGGAFLADLVNSKLLKPIFERPRPTGVILRTAEQGSYSFPSSHSVDAFFFATIFGLFFPKLRRYLYPLVTLTAISRVYCGVHYPGDVLIGAIVGILFGYGFYFIVKALMTRQKAFSVFFCLIFSFSAFGLEDPTKGKPFFPWLWEDQFKPTLKKSVDKDGLTILAVGGASSLVVHQYYDKKIDRFARDGGNLWMDHEDATQFGKLGNGLAGIAIFGTQMVFDQENGLRTGRALILTTISHMSIAGLVQRNRPDNRSDFLPYPSSFPSGHTSSAFAVAGSMAYSYGWKGGVPAYLAAGAISVSRIKERRHWASDIIAGAFLGTFWARASFSADKVDKQAFFVMPVPVYDGMMLSALKEF